MAEGYAGSTGIPRYHDADETRPLLTHDTNGGRNERVKLKGSLEKLQSGLKNWININKTRKDQLGQSVEKCENIKERSSDVESLMAEASRIRQQMKKILETTTAKLKQQTDNLEDLDKATKKVGEQMKEIAEWSPWAPPSALIGCTMVCLLLVAVLLGLPYIINAAGIQQFNIPKDPLGLKSASLVQPIKDTVPESIKRPTLTPQRKSTATPKRKSGPLQHRSGSTPGQGLLRTRAANQEVSEIYGE